MRHVRILGLCLIAALAVGAYAVSSASALPEWGKCEAKAGGKYKNSNCTEKAKLGQGTFEFRKASEVATKRVAEGKSKNIPFSGHSVGGGGVLTSVARECTKEGSSSLGRLTRKACVEKGDEVKVAGEGEQLNVECANESNTGEAEAPGKVTKVKVLFTGCAALGSLPCHSSGKGEGEVETNTLKGSLGYIKKSTKEVGVLLEPVKKGGLFAEFECGSAALAVHTDVGVGSSKQGTEFTSSGCFGVCAGALPTEEAHGGYDGIISPITPVDQTTKEYTQVYSQEAEYPHRNLPTHFEGKHLEALEDVISITTETAKGESMWSSAGEVITNTNTSEEEGEIKA